MSAATTAAAGGEEHWLLKSTKSRVLRIPPSASAVAAAASAGQSPPQGLTVCPIKLEACSRRAFENSVRFQRKFLELRAYEFMGERIHGRRCGDEVELFGFGRDGEDTPGLREALEAKGLTIRTFPSPAASSSSSSSSSTTTESPASPAVRPVAFPPPSRTRDPPAPAPVPVPVDPAEKSFLKNCSAKMHSAVVAHELATHEPTPYALIADAEIPGRRRLLGVIVDQAEFEQVCTAHEKGEKGEGEKQGKVEANGVLYPILGVYAKGSTVWWRKGEELKGFFGTEGRKEVEVVWFSRVKEEVERARREKRREKKERRREMVAAPTSAAPAAEEDDEKEDNEEVGPPAEKPVDEEAQLRAQAKKDKEKARKKAYQARRRQNKKHVKVQEFGGTSATGSQDKNQADDEQESSDDNKATKKTHLRGADLHAILQVLTQRERAAYLSGSRQQLTTTASNNTARRLPTPRFTTMTKRPRIIADDSDEATEPDTSSSSSDSDEEDDAEGEGHQRPNIVHVSSLEEGREAIRQAAAAGSNVVMATMEDLDVMFGRQRRDT
ncbi:hypothetical protein KC331_g13574 [Hortaea werneckii]|uniref:Uncharacterized protein n=1 Tax=Hortaea werneckii TaxID=91943 RepID=A0A3M7B2X5_HORWE|nr:hypothetical protein KC331_g13574 [Hortaea werneckii]KAI7705219.1 hypothetical protein KC353_g13009 [Hortaea werneckii]RMY34132.1 hypothetical protein D0865_14267 [Hortaea werneckii]